MYVVMVRCHIKPEQLSAFQDAIADNARHSVLDEPGCQRFDVVQEVDDPTLIWLYEVYDDRAAFEYHTTTPHFFRWRDASKDMFTEPNRVSFANSLVMSEDATA
jgi:(4S)-4-hydroxy-5-phosphonooxypentane-2,3-dione isomerase